MSQPEKQRAGRLRSASELLAMQARAVVEHDELTDKCASLELRFVDLQIDGNKTDKQLVREELQGIREKIADAEALLSVLPDRIKEAEQRELMTAIEQKHPEAKELQQRELALHVDLYKLSSKLMATLDELAKVTPALSKLNAEFSSAGRRDLYVPVAEAVLRGKTGIANNYRLDAIVNRDAVRDVTAAFGLETLAREFDNGELSH
jgi:predicted nuclease with TOPRIM domain